MIFWIILGVIILLAIAFLILKYKMHWFLIFFGKDAMEIGKVCGNFVNNKISADEYKEEVVDLIFEYDKKERKTIRKRKLDRINKNK